MKRKIIAVDFDGTLCESAYPDIGAPRTEVLKAIIKEQQQGAKIILWTCRGGEALAEAVYWSAKHDLVFDAINENLIEISEALGRETRKIYADEYWDDRAVFPFDRGGLPVDERIKIARAAASDFSNHLIEWLKSECRAQQEVNEKFCSLTAAIKADVIADIIKSIQKADINKFDFTASICNKK